MRVVEGETYNALAAADAAIVSSGTATVEAALLNAPMVVVYRVSPLTATLAKPLVRTPFFAMVNLIAEKTRGPGIGAGRLHAGASGRGNTEDSAGAQCTRGAAGGLAEVRKRLGPPGAVERAADQIAVMLRNALATFLEH